MFSKENSTKVRATFTLDRSVVDDLKKLKKDTGIPASYFINFICRMVLDETLQGKDFDSFQEDAQSNLVNHLLASMRPKDIEKIDLEALMEGIREEIEKHKKKTNKD